MRIAEKTGQSVEQAQATTSAIWFLRWRLLLQQEMEEEFDREWKTLHREDLYLAQIAMLVAGLQHTVANLFAKAPQAFTKKASDFLIDQKKAETPGESSEPESEVVVEDEEVKYQAKLAAAKSRWFAAVGIKDDGTPDVERIRQARG